MDGWADRRTDERKEEEMENGEREGGKKNYLSLIKKNKFIIRCQLDQSSSQLFLYRKKTEGV